MQNQAKQIYLEYCHNTEIQPLIQVLDILEGNTDSCKLHRQDSDPEAYLQENDMFALCLVISQNLENFVELEIQNDVLDANHLSNLASAITSNSHLERLSLVNDSIDDHGVQNLSGALVENNPLLELNLSQNMIKDVGADALSYILFAENCRLEKLNLSRNMIEMDFLGPVLEGKTSLTELDLSYNNYSAESIEQLLRGASNNNTLITLNLEGMKGATNLNAIALVDLIKKNSSLRQIGIDLDLSLLDENMIVKLEEALLENLTLFSIVSPTLEISLNNPQTANIFKILKANEWLARNYEKLCNNEPVDCNDIIEEYVKIKLDLLTQKMSEIPEIQEEPLEEEANSSMQDLPVNNEPVHLPSKNIPALQYQSRKSSKGLVGPSELTSLFISKSDNTGNLESTERNRQPEQPQEYQREQIEDRLAFMHDQIERNLSAQFSKLFEDKVTNYIGGISNQISHVLDRLDNVENKVSSLEKRINPLGFPTVETVGSHQERSTGNFAGIEGRLASLEAHIGIIDKEMKSLEAFREPDYMTRITDEKGETAELRRTIDTQDRLRTMEFDPVFRTDMENIYTERANFERQAKDNFGDIFRKLEDLEGMMDQVIQDQLKDQEVISKQLGSSIMKEKDELEKIVSARVDNLLTDRIDQLEGTFKSGMVNLRNAVYDTQNRVKEIEHCIVENTELDFRGWKKKIVTNNNQQQLTQSAGLKSSNGAGLNNSKGSTVTKSNKSSILEKSTNTNKGTAKTNPIKAHFAKSQGPATSKPQNTIKDSKAILVQEEPEEDMKPSFAFSHAGYSRPEIDDPLSLNELQASMFGSHEYNRNVGRLNLPERDRDEERPHRKADLRENAMNSAMSNLPASMRRVKEEIKKKIEDYRAAISPYKRDKENTTMGLGLSTSAHKMFTESRLDSTVSDNFKARKSLKAEPVGRNIQPSDELVSMLKTRGFAFSNPNAS